MRIPFSIGAGIGVGVVAVVALSGIGFVLYKNREKFNPVSDKNLAYISVNKVGADLTGDQYFTLGTWLYNVTHPDEAKDLVKGSPGRSSQEPAPISGDGGRLSELNPYVL